MNQQRSSLGKDLVGLELLTAEQILTILDTADMQPKLGSPAGADMSADIAALPTGNENADALLDRANGIETGLTPRQAQRLIAASTAGKLSGLPAGTPAIFRNAVADAKARITATTDADGNRTAITYDVT